jgi:three-Cys-motif partner protein
MPENKTFWNSDGSHLPEVEPHTKAKHRLVEEYIQNWIVTLCGNNIGKRKKVMIVDGFCGGGMYRDPENGEMWAGSPIRIIQAVEKGLERVKREKSKPDYDLQAKYIFIDSNKDHLESLKVHMRGNGLDSYLNAPEKCELIHGKFDQKLDLILLEAKKTKCSSFFLLDPFGYTDVSMQNMRDIIDLKKSEILYTFMIEFVIRFLKERDGKLKKAFEKVLEADDYYEIKTRFNSTPAEQEWLKDQTLNLFRKRTNANFVYGFSLLHNQSIVKYYLIHLASSVVAQRVMKLAMWVENNLDFLCRHHDQVYGLGHKSIYYYEDQNFPRIFDIKHTNTQSCIENLDKDFQKLISDGEGIQFSDFEIETIQKNPATIRHYAEFVNQQREAKEIEVIRDGKITTSKQVKSTDIILRAKYKQTKLFT